MNMHSLEGQDGKKASRKSEQLEPMLESMKTLNSEMELRMKDYKFFKLS